MTCTVGWLRSRRVKDWRISRTKSDISGFTSAPTTNEGRIQGSFSFQVLYIRLSAVDVSILNSSTINIRYEYKLGTAASVPQGGQTNSSARPHYSTCASVREYTAKGKKECIYYRPYSRNELVKSTT